MSSKAVDVYMKLTALRYLHQTIGPLIKEIITSKKNFEVDPTRLDKGDDIKKNWKNAKAIVTEILTAIFASCDSLPS
jgi:Ras GTPase-activating protein 3